MRRKIIKDCILAYKDNEIKCKNKDTLIELEPIESLSDIIFKNCTFCYMLCISNSKIVNSTFKDCIFENFIFSNCVFENIVFNSCKFTTPANQNVSNILLKNRSAGYSGFLYCRFVNIKIIDCKINFTTIKECSFYKLMSYDIKYKRSTVLQFNHLIGNRFEKCNLAGFIYLGTRYTDQVEVNPLCITDRLPRNKTIIGWKAIFVNPSFADNVFLDKGIIIAKLEIPASAKRLTSYRRTNCDDAAINVSDLKCRCDKAKVLGFYTIEEDGRFIELKDIYSAINHTQIGLNEEYKYTIYTKNKFVYPDSFDNSTLNACSHGIHFFTDLISVLRWIQLITPGTDQLFLTEQSARTFEKDFGTIKMNTPED